MPDIFLHGALTHAPLLCHVLGRPADLRPADLPDHSLRWSGDPADLPLLTPDPGATAPGARLAASAEDVARLCFYLATDKLDDLRLSDGRQALAWVAPSTAPHWDAAAWGARWGDLATAAARAVMAQPADSDPARIAGLRPFLTARAWAQVLGQQTAPATLRGDPGRDAVEIVADHPGHEGFFRLRRFDLRHRRFDGTWSPPMGREAFIAYDAALILPYDPVTDCVLLIEQLRYGPVMRGDSRPWMLEPVAGLVDAGEDPAACALREAREEAGLDLAHAEPMLKVYASPGYSTEYFHCFLGVCDLSRHATGLGGLAEEHEDIRSHVIPFDQAMALVDSGEINAAPLATMLLWLARARPRLRAAA
ncbi:NUDIX domain-containing protein [Salipiger manganoxidans]|uniref:NUDIX domain-containing protein n=1 Tax=Salipiger marinus TaxID=555512 RepID=UPI001E4A4EF2|nr:NUDIX domain-containing protein [Salipiger manganoxidans]MCD1616629.1 NUDIX domain-containing protein [Salipiger manganoxidans]